jgi:GAF domain-containing protein
MKQQYLIVQILTASISKKIKKCSKLFTTIFVYKNNQIYLTTNNTLSMAEDLQIKGNTKEEKYQSIIPQIKALIDGETDTIANMANICAALKYGFNFFWVGFYLVKDNQLVLAPFQGPVACTRIHLGKGVCGTAWKNNEVIIVDDVDNFPGHIACSSLSKSEIVLPIYNSTNEIIGVLDIDSDEYATFDKTDELYLNQILKLMEQ